MLRSGQGYLQESAEPHNGFAQGTGRDTRPFVGAPPGNWNERGNRYNNAFMTGRFESCHRTNETVE